jgi:hypothetical protein
MKNTFSFKGLSIVFSIAVAFAIMQACVKKEEILKDFEFTIDADIIKIPLSLQIIDGNFESGTNPEGVKIELVGPDKDKFYSSIGKKELTVVNGIVDFAVKKTDAPTVQNPLNVTVVATAPGYLRTIKTFKLTTADSTRFEAISMVNLASAPKGVTVKTASVEVGATGAAAATITTTPTTSVEVVNVEVPAGTQFKDKDGNVLTGTASATLVHFDNQDPASLAAFPGGFSVNSSKDANGNNIGAGEFTTMGFLALDMTIGGKEVKNFSGTGIKISMDLNESSINPETGNPIAIGDSLPIWSLNETDNSWVREKVGVVTGVAGNLKLVYTQNHLSYWNLDFFSGANCSLGGNITLTGITVPGNYYIEVVNAVTNQVVTRYASSYDYLYNGKVFTFQLAPRINAYFRIRSGTAFYCAGTLLGRSNTFSLCGANATATFAMTVVEPGANLSLTVTASGTCANNPRLVIRPNAALYYRKTGCPYWLPAGALIAGTFQSSLFKAGQTYDFKAVVGTTAITQLAVQIPATAVGNYAIAITGTIPPSLCF